MQMLPTDHDIAAVAQAPLLLVVSDFDGTLAEFSTDPANVPVNEDAVSALKRLSRLDNTEVAILSGRHVDGLRLASGFGDEFTLVGSHGAESSGAEIQLSDAQQRTLEAAGEVFEQLIEGVDGAFVEYKPFHRVLHVAKVEDRSLAQELLAKALDTDIDGLLLQPGKNIVEAAVLDINKGTWVRNRQEELGADAVLFLGDDTTDETVFAILGNKDLGVKVGEGETLAQTRVADVPAVAVLLSQIAQAREAAQA